MDYFTLKHRFENNYLLKLLKSRSAAMFLSFIYKEFKTNHLTSLEFNDLVIKLITHLEDIKWDIPEMQTLEEYGKKLIELWCSDDYKLLRRYFSKDAQMFLELTTDSERSLRWMDELNPKDYVGTESRFNNIYRLLEELSTGVNQDPQVRLKELKEERRKIDLEIKEIKESGEVKTLNSFQIEERFHQVSMAARELLSEFKEVDDNFRSLVHNFYIKGLDEDSRGELLGATLDGYSELLDSAQGRSFSGFWNFLISDMGSDNIGKMVHQIYDNLDNSNLGEDRFLMNLKKYLHDSGQNVLKTNHKLAAKLNRILSDPKKRENRRLIALIQEIKTDILQSKYNFNSVDKDFIYIDGVPEIDLPLERPLSYPEIRKIYEIPTEQVGNITDFAKLFSFHSIERVQVNRVIKKSLQNRNRVYLSGIIESIPIKHGLEEILTYFDIASSNPKYSIISEKRVTVNYQINDIKKSIELPEILFCS